MTLPWVTHFLCEPLSPQFKSPTQRSPPTFQSISYITVSLRFLNHPEIQYITKRNSTLVEEPLLTPFHQNKPGSLQTSPPSIQLCKPETWQPSSFPLLHPHHAPSTYCFLNTPHHLHCLLSNPSNPYFFSILAYQLVSTLNPSTNSNFHTAQRVIFSKDKLYFSPPLGPDIIHVGFFLGSRW